MSKKNTFRVFKLPKTIPSELEIAKKGFTLKAQQMLKPPVKMFGILAMHKLAEDIVSWSNEECFKHLVKFATTPPRLPSSYEHSDGMRSAQADVLETLAKKYNFKDWVEASKLFRKSGELIVKLCETVMNRDRTKCSEYITQIADIEEMAYASYLG